MAPAPKGVKRGNQGFKGAGSALKKQRSVFRVQGIVQGAGAVAKALKDAALPASVVTTLRDAASYCLCTPADDRHESEVCLAKMIGEALVGIEGSLTANINKLQGLVDGQDEERLRRDAAVPLSAKALAAKKSEMANAEADLEIASFNREKTAAAFKVALKAKTAGEGKINAITDAKTAITSIHLNMIEPITRAASSKKELAALVKVLSKHDIDLSPHVTSQQVALCKEVADRTEFDTAVLQNLEKEVSTKLAELNAALEGEEVKKQGELFAVAEKAKQTDEEAAAHREKAKEVFQRANAATKEAEKALNNAKGATHTYAADMKQAVTDLAVAKQKRSEFRDGPWTSYVKLKDLKQPSPPPAAEAAPAETPAATAV